MKSSVSGGSLVSHVHNTNPNPIPTNEPVCEIGLAQPFGSSGESLDITATPCPK